MNTLNVLCTCTVDIHVLCSRSYSDKHTIIPRASPNILNAYHYKKTFHYFKYPKGLVYECLYQRHTDNHIYSEMIKFHRDKFSWIVDFSKVQEKVIS